MIDWVGRIQSALCCVHAGDILPVEIRSSAFPCPFCQRQQNGVTYQLHDQLHYANETTLERCWYYCPKCCLTTFGLRYVDNRAVKVIAHTYRLSSNTDCLRMSSDVESAIERTYQTAIKHGVV